MKDGINKIKWIAFLLAFSSTTIAEIDPMRVKAAVYTGWGIGVGAGSWGYTVEANYAFSFGWRARFIYSGLDKLEYQDDLYEASIDHSNAGVLINWHPFWGSFHFSVGALSNRTDMLVSVNGSAANQFLVGDSRYGGRLSLATDFPEFASYAGIGWSTASRPGLGYSIDIGALYQGDPNVVLSGTITESRMGIECAYIVSSGNPFTVSTVGNNSICTQSSNFAETSLLTEYNQRLDDFKLLRFYPVLSFALTYRF